MLATETLPEIHPISFALKYDPPTIVLQYSRGDDPNQDFAHPVKLVLGRKAAPGEIVDELIREESLYFGPKLIARAQVRNLTRNT